MDMAKLTPTEIGAIIGFVIGLILLLIFYLAGYAEYSKCLFSIWPGTSLQPGTVCLRYISLLPLILAITGIILGYVIKKIKDKKEDKAYFQSYES